MRIQKQPQFLNTHKLPPFEVIHAGFPNYFRSKFLSNQVACCSTGFGWFRRLLCKKGSGLQWRAAFSGCPKSRLDDRQLQFQKQIILLFQIFRYNWKLIFYLQYKCEDSSVVPTRNRWRLPCGYSALRRACTVLVRRELLPKPQQDLHPKCLNEHHHLNDVQYYAKPLTRPSPW